MIGHTLRIIRKFPFPPERVFTGWSDLEVFGRWFMTDWGRCASGEFRPGGTWRIEGVDPGGAEVACAGEYLEIEAPTLVAFTFEWSGGAGIPEKGPRPIAVTFRAEGAGTEMVFEHDGIESPESLHEHRKAWVRGFAILERMLASPGG